MKPIRILRIDPMKRLVAAIPFKAPGKDATREVARILRAKEISWRGVMQVGDVRLCAAGATGLDESTPSWTVPGAEDTAGISILFGNNAAEQMVDCPVTIDWLRRRIVWVAGEDAARLAERAAETVPLINDDIREIITKAIVTPTGIWITADQKAQFGEGMMALDLGTERSGGQMLSRLGEHVFDILGETV